MLTNLQRVLDRDGKGKHEIKKSNTNLRYLLDEKKSTPAKKELVQFVFEHSYLWDDDLEAFYVLYLQSSYLIPEYKLLNSHYLPYLYVYDAIDNFFYIDIEKCEKFISKEECANLLRLQKSKSLSFNDDCTITFTNEFDLYKEKVQEYIHLYGFENIIYTFDDVMDETKRINEDYPIFLDEESFSDAFVYLQKLLPQLETDCSYIYFYSSLIELMESLLWSLDDSHILKIHYLKNLRLLTKQVYVGMTVTIKKKIKSIAEMEPEMFRHLKR